MLYDVIYSRIFYNFLYATWLCDYDHDIYDNPVTCVTVMHDIMLHFYLKSKIRRKKRNFNR